MNLLFQHLVKDPDLINPASAYLPGAIIAIIILGYLLYALVKPEKF